MVPDKVERLQLTTLLLCITVLLSACSGINFPNQATNGEQQEGSSANVAGAPSISEQIIYPVDGLFEQFYEALGGLETLGPAISPLNREGTRQLQYVENALMVYDASATNSDRFTLAPLGLDFGVAEQSAANTLDSGGRYVGGHFIWPEFVAKYDALGGVRFVGEPITEAHYNPSRNRTEQYFENLGFYRLEKDQPGVVRLMAYGAFSCDYRCRYKPPSSSIPSRQQLLPEPFQSQAVRLGSDFTGRTLTDVHQGADQNQEVIFENMVLYTDRANPEKVLARPIVELLGFLAHVPADPSADPLMAFYEIQDGKGYNVPRLYENYLQQHGGIEFSGLPLSEVFPTKTGAYRQCYENLCLEYNIHAAQPDRLKPVPLGVRYMEEVFDEAPDFEKSLSVMNIDILPGEEYDSLPAGQPQRIYVLVSEDGVGLKNREPILILSNPDGTSQTTFFPPTGVDGRTSVEIPGIQAPNFTLIPYSVCLLGFDGEQRCVRDNFLIWNSK